MVQYCYFNFFIKRLTELVSVKLYDRCQNFNGRQGKGWENWGHKISSRFDNRDKLVTGSFSQPIRTLYVVRVKMIMALFWGDF